MDVTTLPSTALDVLLVMAKYADSNNVAPAKVSKFGTIVGKTRRTVHRIIKQLENEEFITLQSSKNPYSTYKINVDLSKNITEVNEVLLLFQSIYQLQKDSLKIINEQAKRVIHPHGMLWVEIEKQKNVLQENTTALAHMFSLWATQKGD